MAKPATVERKTCDPRKMERDRKLRLVKTLAQEPHAPVVRRKDLSRPEAADDLDEMWDNVPV